MTLTLLKFEAEWCGPCTQQEQLLENFDDVPIETIDVDEEPDLANEYSVRSIPTLILEDDSGPVTIWTGLTQPAEIRQSIENVK